MGGNQIAGQEMKRRDVTLIAAWPMLVTAEHRIPRVGVLWHASDVKGETRQADEVIE